MCIWSYLNRSPGLQLLILLPDLFCISFYKIEIGKIDFAAVFNLGRSVLTTYMGKNRSFG